MVCQCSGTWKGIKSKVGGELDISLQALFAYLCVFYVLVIALIPRNLSSNPNTINMVHNGAPNVGAHFNGYFYNCKSIIKFERNFMSFVVGRASSTFWSLLPLCEHKFCL